MVRDYPENFGTIAMSLHALASWRALITSTYSSSCMNSWAGVSLGNSIRTIQLPSNSPSSSSVSPVATNTSPLWVVIRSNEPLSFDYWTGVRWNQAIFLAHILASIAEQQRLVFSASPPLRTLQTSGESTERKRIIRMGWPQQRGLMQCMSSLLSYTHTSLDGHNGAMSASVTKPLGHDAR